MLLQGDLQGLQHDLIIIIMCCFKFFDMRFYSSDGNGKCTDVISSLSPELVGCMPGLAMSWFMKSARQDSVARPLS